MDLSVEEQEEIVSDYVEDYKDISKPIFIIGYKDKLDENDQVKKDLAIDIICNILIGKSSRLHQRLYKALPVMLRYQSQTVFLIIMNMQKHMLMC